MRLIRLTSFISSINPNVAYDLGDGSAMYYNPYCESIITAFPSHRIVLEILPDISASDTPYSARGEQNRHVMQT
jgi:hypothetical protein